jgi:tellurite resistance protein
VREELADPARLGFCATLPVGMVLVAAAAAPHAPALAQALWWCGAPLFLLLQAWALALLAGGRVRLAHVNGGALIVMVAGIVMPFAGLPLGHPALSTFMYCASASAAPLVMAAILYRQFAGPPLPAALRPTLFILLVPPSLVYLNGEALWPGRADAALEWLYPVALLLAAALLAYARRLHRWPFGAAWWALTFPLDALAGAAARYASAHPGGPWSALAGALMLLATLVVALVLARTLAALARGTLLKPA